MRESKSELNRKKKGGRREKKNKGYVLNIRGPVFLLRQEQFVTGCVLRAVPKVR